MMEYRQLPHGEKNEKFSVLGLGMGGIQRAPDEEIEHTVRRAIVNGVNYFDLCGGAANVYAPFGRAIRAVARRKIFFQMHFGAVYDEEGNYGWTTDAERIKRTFDWEMETLGVDYIDMGFLHCIDKVEDFEKLEQGGIVNLVQELKRQGVVRHIGFSSHTPQAANRILDTGFIDMMMFSVNAAYDFEYSDDLGMGSAGERAALLRRCQEEGVGISVMKPFHAGKLLDARESPFGRAMTRNQCIQYALDCPGVLTVVPGVRGLDDLNELLTFPDAAQEERDYSFIRELTPKDIEGHCVYCSHCHPCPAGIDIGLVNKYYDLARAGDELAKNHYRKLGTKASACRDCGHCDRRCPFQVEQSRRMREIAEYFGE